MSRGWCPLGTGQLAASSPRGLAEAVDYPLPVRSPPPAFGDVLEFRVSLRHIAPAIWRTLRVPADVPLSVLHEVLQVAFGWQNCHLHDFQVGDIRFSTVDTDDEMLAIDERGAPFGAVARAGSKLVYVYDLGDSWEHDIVVERVDQRGDPAICCTGGAGACPPEDSGGPLGYAHLLEVLANPKHEEHAELKLWAPRGFDPRKFNAAAVTKKLATLSKRARRHHALTRLIPEQPQRGKKR